MLFPGETFFGGEIELAHQVEFSSLQLGVGTGWFDVGDRGVARVEDRALIGGGEITGVEVVETSGRDEASVENDESGKVLVLGAESVSNPGSHAGASLQARAGVEEVVRRGVFGELGGHRLDESEIIGNPGDVGKKVADPGSGFAVLFEGPGGLHDLADVIELGGLELADGLAGILSVEFFEERFVVEGVDLRGTAVHVEEDDVLRLGSVVGFLGSEGIGGVVVRRFGSGVFGEESGESHRSKSTSGLLEHVPAGEGSRSEILAMHGEAKW